MSVLIILIMTIQILKWRHVVTILYIYITMHNSYDVIEIENNVTLNTLQTRHIFKQEISLKKTSG